MKRLPLIVLFFFVCVALIACGETSNPSTTQQSSSSKEVTPSPASQLKPETATDIFMALKSKVSTIGDSFVYTEDNDPNKLLNRPGQYTGKVNFKDTRIVREGINDVGPKIEVRDGGGIETFASAEDANSRFKYIQAISKSASMFAEYEYLQGRAILRISSELTPSKAKEYESAFRQIA